MAKIKDQDKDLEETKEDVSSCMPFFFKYLDFDT